MLPKYCSLVHRWTLHIVCSLGLAGTVCVGVHPVLALELVATFTGHTIPGAPSQIEAGVPYLVRDTYGTQLCVSSRSGHPLLPYIVAPTAEAFPSPTKVAAGVPFVVRDEYGTQFCVSSRGGQLLPPFVVP